MECAQVFVKRAIFMENFMSNSKLNSIQIWEDKQKANKIKGVDEVELKSWESIHGFKEEAPISNNRSI